MSITIAGFHHAGFLVTDVERAAAFYEGVLGLGSLPRPDFGFRGRWYDLGHGHQLHLMETDKSSGQTGLANFDRHIALMVRDIDETARHLADMGVAVSEGSGRAGARQLFVRDPDGNMIELRNS